VSDSEEAEPDYARRLADSIERFHRDAPRRDNDYRLFKETLDQAAVLVDEGRTEKGAELMTRLARERAETNNTDVCEEFFFVVRHFNLGDQRPVAEVALRAAYDGARESHASLEPLHAAAHALGFAELLINHLLRDKRWGEAASQQELVVELTEVVYGEPAVSCQLRWLEQISSHVPDLDPSLAQQRRLFTVSVLRRSLAAYQRTFPEDHLLVGDAHIRLGIALANAGETSEAAQELAHGLEISADAPTDEVMAARLLLADLRSH